MRRKDRLSKRVTMPEKWPADAYTTRVSAAKALKHLASVPGTWATVSSGKKLRRTFVLPDFLAVMHFLLDIADYAEFQGHHPDFSVSYNRVEFTIWTHSLGCLTVADLRLAAFITGLSETHGAAPEGETFGKLLP